MKNVAPAIFAPNGIGDAKPDNRAVLDWVHEIGTLTNPENIFWCDGSDRENQFLLDQAVQRGVLLKLNEEKVPRSYLHRSNPNDVARVEQFTFICTPTKEEAGPTNNWAEPAKTYTKLHGLLKGAMRGRTMYVIPYLMGPPGSPLTKVGFEITDSIYVVLNMRIMTRMGEVAVKRLGNDPDANGIAACTRCSMSIRSGGSFVIFRRTTRLFRSARATAAMFCSARNVWLCGSVRIWRKDRVGWRSTC